MMTLDARTLWTLASGDSMATCDAVGVDGRFEARYFVDDALVRSQMFDDIAALEEHATDAREAFEALGWHRPEPSDEA
jgi:hypothetical protein